MDLGPYLENIQRQLAAAGEAGGAETRAVAERLTAPLDAAIRLALQDALATAAEEITCELAPGSVELRLRGGHPEFVVVPPSVEVAGPAQPWDFDERAAAGRTGTGRTGTAALAGLSFPPVEGDEGGMARINLRMPDQLKSRIERAAGREGLSVNAWLVRAAGAALDRASPTGGGRRRGPPGPQRYQGWAR
jgi:hypothetical protein